MSPSKFRRGNSAIALNARRGPSASLNHPNVCTLYDVGPNYLVTELIDGTTLAEYIARGPVPVNEALGIVRQIVYALEAAHEKGIVHRDLKPANVKIRPDGSVKVLDFGLAKTGDHAETTADSSTIMMSGISTPGDDPRHGGVFLSGNLPIRRDPKHANSRRAVTVLFAVRQVALPDRRDLDNGSPATRGSPDEDDVIRRRRQKHFRAAH